MSQSLLVALFLKWSCMSATEGSTSVASCLDLFLALALALAFAFFEGVCVLGEVGTGQGVEEGDRTHASGASGFFGSEQGQGAEIGTKGELVHGVGAGAEQLQSPNTDRERRPQVVTNVSSCCLMSVSCMLTPAVCFAISLHVSPLRSHRIGRL
jgi:hypothetical protein